MTVTVNGLQFHVEETGVGPVVLLLHGFPDTGEVWRRQVPALVAAGFRAVVPDLRGRGRSERPGRVEAYALPELVADATGILERARVERAHVVGHDWGAALAWSIAALSREGRDEPATPRSPNGSGSARHRRFGEVDSAVPAADRLRGCVETPSSPRGFQSFDTVRIERRWEVDHEAVNLLVLQRLHRARVLPNHCRLRLGLDGRGDEGVARRPDLRAAPDDVKISR